MAHDQTTRQSTNVGAKLPRCPRAPSDYAAAIPEPLGTTGRVNTIPIDCPRTPATGAEHGPDTNGLARFKARVIER
jgi:hypothetical protein